MRGVFIGYDSSDIVVRVDPDAYWKDFLTWDAEERVEAVATNGLHWRVMLDSIDLPQKAKEGFWNEFKRPGALMNRKRALLGLVLSRREEETLLIERTREMLDRFAKSVHRGLNGDAHEVAEAYRQSESGWAAIGIRFSNYIYNNDFNALRKMADILESGNELDAQKMKGGVESPDGKTLRAFVDLHVENRKLPTRKELLDGSGLTDEKAASKSAINLGFSGLSW